MGKKVDEIVLRIGVNQSNIWEAVKSRKTYQASAVSDAKRLSWHWILDRLSGRMCHDLWTVTIAS